MSGELEQEKLADLPPVMSGGAAAGVLEAPAAEPAVEATAFVASQWQLMWWKFRKHRLAAISGVVVIALYLVALFVEFLAPFDPNATNGQYTYAPPQRLHLIRQTPEGTRVGLYVYGYTSKVDQATLSRTFITDPSQVIPVRLFPRGNQYRLFGVIPWDRHLLGPADPSRPMYLLGADHLGQDLLSRLIYGTRISMSIGLVGVFLSLTLGILFGGVSGYFGGGVDTVMQRVIEFLRSIPHIPLWLGLAAALPKTWSPLRIYFGITLILSLIGWTSLARVVRGRFLSLREEDFVTAARLDGASEMRLIWRYMVPSFLSHIIASLTLAIPGTILAETSLSFLGLGLRPPLNSWGVLLQEAQNIRAVATAPWLLLPGVLVVVAVLALNFLGDGLRDAADPYAA
ncbi:MAG TPA: ABC transporter permease [Thermomicrobiales bacterium]|nr:ABC transporter permease [Thermomicrobiales bacterium]